MSKPKTHFEQVPMKIVKERAKRRSRGSSKLRRASLSKSRPRSSGKTKGPHP